MLAAVTRSPGEMVIEDVPGPAPARAGNVIVRPEAVGICGSDFHLFSGDVAALSGARDFYPRIQGHEVSALVEDPGEATALKEGDRVAIWPLLPCGSCYPCRALARANLRPGEQAVVFGAGPIGLAATLADDFRTAISLVKTNQASVTALFSHHFPLARAAEAFEFAMKRPPDAFKIVVTVN